MSLMGSSAHSKRPVLRLFKGLQTSRQAGFMGRDEWPSKKPSPSLGKENQSEGLVNGLQSFYESSNASMCGKPSVGLPDNPPPPLLAPT